MKKDEREKLKVEELTELSPEEKEYAEHLGRRAELSAICDDLRRPQNWMDRLALREPKKKPGDFYKELEERRAELEQKEYEYMKKKLSARKKANNPRSGFSYQEEPYWRPLRFFVEPLRPLPPWCHGPAQSGTASLIGLRHGLMKHPEDDQTERYGGWSPFPSEGDYWAFNMDFNAWLITPWNTGNDSMSPYCVAYFDLPESQEKSWIRWSTEVYLQCGATCNVSDKGFAKVFPIYTMKAQVDPEDPDDPYNYDYELVPPVLSCSTGYGLEDCYYEWFAAPPYHIEDTCVVPEERVLRVYIGLQVDLYAKGGWAGVDDGILRIGEVQYTSYPYPF